MQKQRLPRYGRVRQPPAMRLTKRDQRIFEAIHNYDGMLGFSQIQQRFFSGKSQTEHRLKLLYQHHYLNRPNEEQRRRIPEMVYWLDKKGAEMVAGLEGTLLKDFRWRKKPRWFQVEHDLAVNNFRLLVDSACQATPNFRLETWIPESEFLAFPDRIEYHYRGRKKERSIRPDGSFRLLAHQHRLHYLVEIDRSTEDNPRFQREKLVPGLAYLKSKAYQQRFGKIRSRWLVVTTGERRLANMLRQARRCQTGGRFYFTTYDKLRVESLLLAPIWQREDRTDLVPLVFLN